MSSLTHLTDLLTDLGLREKEAQVYLAALSLGPTTILSISRNVAIKRSTVYTIVESLIRKGLMSIQVTGLKKRYRAETPEKLAGLLEFRRQRLHEKLPELMRMYTVEGNENFIQYFDGLEALKTVYLRMIHEAKPGSAYRVIGSHHDWYYADESFFQKFIEERAKLNLDVRLLLVDSEITRTHKTFEENYHEEIRILPKESGLTTNLVITENKVLVHHLKPPVFGIVIENTSIVHMQTEVFDMLWRMREQD